MKFFILLILFAVSTAFAQTKPEVLATSTAATFTAESLTSETREAWYKRHETIVGTRKTLLAEMVADHVLSLEAKAQNVTVEKLIADVASKVGEPTADQIQAVYDANRAGLGDASIDDARPRIVKFLKQGESNQALQKFVDELEKKYKVTYGKDVNADPLLPSDALVKIGTIAITAKSFDDANRNEIAKKWYEIYARMRSDLVATIYSTLVIKEAEALNIDSSEYISREVTSKIKDYSDEERESLEDALQKKLFAKYKVKFTASEPVRAMRKVLADDDPASGPVAAPVTVVMFTDFQCPACSRSHPVIKRVLAEYGNRIRFVVRDYPLDMHENAFIAARAANAANAQGKFVLYTEKLYQNQEALDRDSLVKYAGEIGLNVKQFELDFSSEKTAAEIRKDVADGKSYGITGTPAVFVSGVSVWPTAWELRRAIDRALVK